MKFPLMLACLVPVAILAGCAGNSPDSVLKERIALMNELSSVYDTVKDVPSAEAAAPRIKAIGERRSALDQRMGAFNLTPAQYQELTDRHRTELAAASERLLVSKPKDAAVNRNDKFREALKSVR